MTLKINGKDFPVTAKFRAAVLDPHPDLAAAPYGHLESQMKALLDLSTARNNYQAPPIPHDVEADSSGNLTAEEGRRLANIVHVMNCHHAVNFLAGRDHAEFGFDGIDQVHGVKHTLPCGCQIHHVYDYWHGRGELAHEAVADERPIVLHPHYSKRWCARHKEHAGDFRAHHAAVMADPLNTAKPADNG
jgi:hypothetical protein